MKAGTGDLSKYRVMVRMCRDRVRKAKAKLEQDLARDMKNHKKGFCKYIAQKRKDKESVPLLPTNDQE